MKSCCKEAMEKDVIPKKSEKKGLIKWLKRIGIAGFLFFLAKGLMWIAILYGGFRLTGCDG